MNKVWYHKKKKVFCADVTINGRKRRIFLTSRQRDSEILLRKIIRELKFDLSDVDDNQVSKLVSKNVLENVLESNCFHSSVTQNGRILRCVGEQ